jgi:hypothetical protein
LSRAALKKRRKAFMERLEFRTLLSITPIAQPADTLPDGAVYTSAATLIPIAAANGSTFTSATVGPEDVTFSQTMTAETSDTGGWTPTWGTPPAVESANTTLGYETAADSLTLTLSDPASTFGVEMAPVDAGSIPMTATFYDGATELGSITKTVDSTAGNDGAVLFAASTGEEFTSVVLSSPTSGGIALAQMRYIDPVPALTGEAGNAISGVEGSSTGTVLLGTFVDGDQAATVSDYTTGGGSVVVNWGDGSAPQTLAAGNLTAIGSANGVEWTINAAHTYTEEGTFAYTVTVTSSDGAATIVSGSADIADASLTPGAPVALTPNTGVALPGGTVVATFTDANTFATTADYTAQVDWGDGSSPSTGVVVATATPGVFDVETGHAYADRGTYSTYVTVTDDGGSRVTITGTATVTDLPVSGSTKNFTAIEGINTGLFVLATFEDPNTLATLSDVSATLAIGGWGDGTPTTAGVPLVVQQTGVDPSTGDPTFEVLGSHAYAEHTAVGTPDPLSVIVTTLGGTTTTLTSPPGGGVTVLDAPLTGTAGNLITAVEGNSTGTVLLGSFVDADQSATVADYTTNGGSVVVNWGDGSAPQTLSSSNLTAIGSADGIEWAVKAAHTYTEEGTFAYTVTVTDDGGSVAVIFGSAVIADAPLTAGSSVNLNANTGATISGEVGSFNDTNPDGSLSDFTATINWGDGSPLTTGVITQPGGIGTRFIVSGTHTYANPGDFDTLITVTDVGGSRVTLTGTATITDLPVTGSVNNFLVTTGESTGTIVLATFSDPNPLATAADVTAFLPIGGWGDGTPLAPVTLTVTAIGGTSTSTLFEVTGSHVYEENGTFTVNISVTTSGGVTTALTSGTATATAPHQLVFVQHPTSLTAGQNIGSIVVDIQSLRGQLIRTDFSDVTLSVAFGPTGGTLIGTTTVSAVKGVATFRNLSLDVAGTYILVASDNHAIIESRKITVKPAAAASIVIASPPSDVAEGSAISPPVSVYIYDAFGNLVSGSPSVTLSVDSGPAGAMLHGDVTVEAKNGVATFKDVSLTVDGTYTLMAKHGSITGTSTSFDVV